MLTFLMVIDNQEARNMLEQLYLAYNKQMFYIANEILKDIHESQDVVQNSILKLVNYADRIECVNCNKTKHLIVTITRNTAIDNYRRKKNYSVIPSEDFDDLVKQDDNTLDELVIKLSEAKELAEKLALLKIEYADILTLKYYNELNDKEIAEILNISHENVRVRLNRAKDALKKLMLSEQPSNQNYKRTCKNEI